MNKEQILASCELPAVPAVAARILKLVEDPLTTVDDFQKAILSDQALTTRVLKIANSAYYGSSREINTVSDAIVMMGIDTIKNLAVAVASREVYRNFGIMEQKLWEHCLGVSICSSFVARYAGHFSIRGEEAVVAGLLHDIGKVIMNNSQPTRFGELTRRVYEERVPYHVIEEEMFGFNHAEVGFLLAEKWDFPESLANTILRHHDCHDDDAFGPDTTPEGLCLAISLADAICARLGVGFRGPMADMDLGEERLRRVIGIGDEEMDEIEGLFKESYVQERLQFQEL